MAKSRRVWWVAAVIVVFGLGGLSAFLQARASRRPPPTIDDATFVRRANGTCRREVRALRAPPRRTPGTTVVQARTLRSVADGLDRVSADLRRLPVEPDDEAQVRAWLDDWDRYTAVGRRYAEAVERNDPEAYSKVDDEAVVLVQRIGRFARANHIDDCVL